jgi:hypothetical protein
MRKLLLNSHLFQERGYGFAAPPLGRFFVQPFNEIGFFAGHDYRPAYQSRDPSLILEKGVKRLEVAPNFD